MRDPRTLLAEARARMVTRLARISAVRVAYALLFDVPLAFTLDRASWLGLLRADLVNPGDPVLLPFLLKAFAARPSRRLRKRIARLSARAGELTAAKQMWASTIATDGELARQSARLLEGLLIETDPTWLPVLRGPREPLEPASRRRILHLLKSSVPDRWSGYTIRSLHNLRAQRDVGLEPIAVTDIGWPREYGVTEIATVMEVDGLVHHRLDRGPSYIRRALPNDVHLQNLTDELVPLVRQIRPAILHAHSAHRGGQYAMVALALRDHFGIPVAYEVRGLFEAGRFVGEGSEQYRRRLAQENRILGEVDAVLPISHALADELVERGIPRDKMTVIPNGIDTASLDRVEPDPGLRARLGLDGRNVLGYVGNLDMRLEGLDVLMSALAELRARGRRDLAALIVGDGTRRQELEALARRLGIADACHFTGRVPHASIANYYRAIDLFVVPRLDERATRLITPIKPFEALALGIPILVSDLPALREIVDPPHRGAAAPAGDSVALGAAIESLIDDPARRARLGEAGRAWVRAERTWAANGPRYRSAYEGVLGPLG